MSPNLIPNLSWYKDVEFSYTQEVLDSFCSKQHILMSLDFHSVWERENDKLSKMLIDFRGKIAEIRKCGSSDCSIAEILSILESIKKECGDFGENFIGALDECIELLKKYKQINVEEVEKLRYLSRSWGRGQQYISFIKR